MLTYKTERATHIPKVWKFPAGEVGVECHYDAVDNRDRVDIQAAITNSDEIMQLLMLTDALRRRYPRASLHLQLGYIPYGRQDRVCNDGESLSIKVFAALINSQGYASVEISDPHSDVTAAVFDRCTVTPQFIIASQLFLPLIPKVRQDVLVAPDAGAVKKAIALSEIQRFREIMVASKMRNISNGRIESYAFDGAVSGKHVVVIDDICDGGMTFILLGRALRNAGVLSATLCVTHGIFSKGTTELLSLYDAILTTNSYHLDREGLVDGVTYLKLI